jgi:hypothetical protein
MYPCYEQKTRWDDYGEVVRYTSELIRISLMLQQTKISCLFRPEEWSDFRLEDLRSDAAKAAAKIHAAAMPATVGADHEDMDVPTKCVSSIVTLTINAQVQFIDFEGKEFNEI